MVKFTLKLNNKAVGEVFNVGSDQEISIKELAEKVIRLTGSASEIEYAPCKEACGFVDIKRRVPDITKIRKLKSTKFIFHFSCCGHPYHDCPD